VHRLCEPGHALEEALVLARAIAKRPPLSVKGSIRAIYVGVNSGSIREGERAEREGFARCASSSDMVEGISAFFGKREAVFEGK
jgi:enoyl-CoA hydratase/carnithine racemase